eukprot:4478356-Pyramimonas_sp.AAC.1
MKLVSAASRSRTTVKTAEVAARYPEGRASRHSSNIGVHGLVNPNELCWVEDYTIDVCFLQWVKGQGVDLRCAGVESPQQIGRAERHGGLWKNALKEVVRDENVIGLDEVMEAAAEVDSAKDEMSRVAGFSLPQG